MAARKAITGRRGQTQPGRVAGGSAEVSAITLQIPCLPDLDLSSNRRRSRHYMAQARDTATERERAAVMLFQAKVNGSWKVPWKVFPVPSSLSWVLYWPKGIRARDADSLASLTKPWMDALVDLGWLKNDSPKYVPTVSYTSVPSSPLGPSMKLVISVAGLPDGD